MQDIAAARLRLIDVFANIGCALIEEQCGPVPAEVAASVRHTVATHLSRHADSDILVIAMFSDSEICDMARSLLAEPMRAVASLFTEAMQDVRVASMRNGADN